MIKQAKCQLYNVLWAILKLEVFRLTSLASKDKAAFQCMVSLDVMKPPMIFGARCKKLIACKDYMRHCAPDTCPYCSGATGDNIDLYQFDVFLHFRIDQLFILVFQTTITHKISETNSSFHVKQRTTEKSRFFKSFLLVLTKLPFWQGDWALGYHSMKFRQFLNIS